MTSGDRKKLFQELQSHEKDMRTGNEADGDEKRVTGSVTGLTHSHKFPILVVCALIISYLLAGGTDITFSILTHPSLLEVVAVKFIAIWFDHCTGLFKMSVRVLTTCHTQYT